MRERFSGSIVAVAIAVAAVSVVAFGGRHTGVGSGRR